MTPPSDESDSDEEGSGPPKRLRSGGAQGKKKYHARAVQAAQRVSVANNIERATNILAEIAVLLKQEMTRSASQPQPDAPQQEQQQQGRAAGTSAA